MPNDSVSAQLHAQRYLGRPAPSVSPSRGHPSGPGTPHAPFRPPIGRPLARPAAPRLWPRSSSHDVDPTSTPPSGNPDPDHSRHAKGKGKTPTPNKKAAARPTRLVSRSPRRAVGDGEHNNIVDVAKALKRILSALACGRRNILEAVVDLMSHIASESLESYLSDFLLDPSAYAFANLALLLDETSKWESVAMKVELLGQGDQDVTRALRHDSTPKVNSAWLRMISDCSIHELSNDVNLVRAFFDSECIELDPSFLPILHRECIEPVISAARAFELYSRPGPPKRQKRAGGPNDVT